VGTHIGLFARALIEKELAARKETRG